MPDVPGAPDPKGFQAGEGGKVILESTLKGVGEVAKETGRGIKQHFKDAADHTRNVQMRAWEMATQHHYARDLAEQSHGHRLTEGMLDIAGKQINIKTKGAEKRKTVAKKAREQRDTFAQVSEASKEHAALGVTEFSGNAKKAKIKAKYGNDNPPPPPSGGAGGKTPPPPPPPSGAATKPAAAKTPAKSTTKTPGATRARAPRTK
jgi:hypothetical protein